MVMGYADPFDTLLWVISGHRRADHECPLYPLKQTSLDDRRDGARTLRVV
jgi:hypothetical protein